MGAEEQRQQKFLRMTQTPIPKLISQLAVPTIISMLVTSFYNMADTFFVGKINTSATAAVGVVFPLMTIIQAFGFFAAMAQETIFPASLVHKISRMHPKCLQPVLSPPFFWDCAS